MDPEYSAAWYKKANSLSSLENYEEAIVCYDEAIKLYPVNSVAWKNKCTALKKLGRDEEAEQCFAKARELDES